jgi:hypothetical protein
MQEAQDVLEQLEQGYFANEERIERIRQEGKRKYR